MTKFSKWMFWKGKEGNFEKNVQTNRETNVHLADGAFVQLHRESNFVFSAYVEVLMPTKFNKKQFIERIFDKKFNSQSFRFLRKCSKHKSPTITARLSARQQAQFDTINIADVLDAQYTKLPETLELFAITSSWRQFLLVPASFVAEPPLLRLPQVVPPHTSYRPKSRKLESHRKNPWSQS